MKTHRTFIIAEAGVNHNGSLELAKELIDAASEAHADAVKFQTFKAENVVVYRSPIAEYQKKTTLAKTSQYRLLKDLELDEQSHRILIEYSKQKNIQFLSTAFDADSLEMLMRSFNLSRIKIPSGEITNGPFLMQAARTKKPILLSTGMSTVSEIRDALSIIAFGYLNGKEKASMKAFRDIFRSMEGRAIVKKKVTLLHCTSEYPAPLDEVNLLAIGALRAIFDMPVGFSDHSEGIYAAVAAVALGATVIEKHFTLNRNLPGPDHQASIEPEKLGEMVQAIRDVERSLGTAKKLPTPSELKNRDIVRKSLVAARQIREGERFSAEDLICKRPGYGLSPMFYWNTIGKKADRSYRRDEKITNSGAQKK
jgi:N-acetylneuraminate synthase